jgi:hypothetical protein
LVLVLSDDDKARQDSFKQFAEDASKLEGSPYVAKISFFVGLHMGRCRRHRGQGKRVVLVGRLPDCRLCLLVLGDWRIDHSRYSPRIFYLHGIVTMTISWIVFFAIRLPGAPGRVYARLEDEKIKLQAELEQLRAKRDNVPKSTMD